ncbi:UNVERIFIED_CONTAM: hypothetical protein GTU68_002580 [Idotea baltica]|nr:hypothetical protein [Idotea baltica]
MINLSRRQLFTRHLSYLKPATSTPSSNHKLSQPRLPWLKEEQLFTEQCTRCNACVEVCTNQIIDTCDGGFPRINFHKNECAFCYQCAQICPESLFLNRRESPWEIKAIISNVCLTKKGVECRSCEESCSSLAISFHPSVSNVAQPLLKANNCTGCGACVSVCPMQAIEVSAADVD